MSRPLPAWSLLVLLSGALGCAAAHGPRRGGATDHAEDEPAAAPEDANIATTRLHDAGMRAAPPDPGRAVVAAAGQPSSAQEVTQPTPPELCNGLDDDGDGKLDEGCPIRAGSGAELTLRGGRLLWFQYPELWTLRLPDGLPELLAPHAVTAATDGEQVLYARDGEAGYTVVDMRDRSERTITPPLPGTTHLHSAAIDGDFVAYARNLRVPMCTGSSCNDSEIYLHDLRSSTTQIVAQGPGTMQTEPRLDRGVLVWMDDRRLHASEGEHESHRYDYWTTTLPYLVGHEQRATLGNPHIVSPLGFAAGRLLTTDIVTLGYEVSRLTEVATGRVLALDAAVVRGEYALALSAEHMIVHKDPLGRCHLERVELASLRGVELFTEGVCPFSAVTDGDFVAWIDPSNERKDIFWLDARDLHAP